MAIRIGHASIDENGKITGGASGDQNGKEVCIRNWYNGGWEFLARPKNAQVAEKMKGLTRKNRDRNAYDAMLSMAARDQDGKALGEKIMKERNANRRV